MNNAMEAIKDEMCKGCNWGHDHCHCPVECEFCGATVDQNEICGTCAEDGDCYAGEEDYIRGR
jgi:hypothetical protein